MKLCELFIYGYIRYITDVLSKNVLIIATPWPCMQTEFLKLIFPVVITVFILHDVHKIQIHITVYVLIHSSLRILSVVLPA